MYTGGIDMVKIKLANKEESSEILKMTPEEKATYEKNVAQLEEMEKKAEETKKRIEDKATDIIDSLKGFSVLEVGIVFNEAQQRILRATKV
jgi:hypothetical protein